MRLFALNIIDDAYCNLILFFQFSITYHICIFQSYVFYYIVWILVRIKCFVSNCDSPSLLVCVCLLVHERVIHTAAHIHTPFILYNPPKLFDDSQYTPPTISYYTHGFRVGQTRKSVVENRFNKGITHRTPHLIVYCFYIQW